MSRSGHAPGKLRKGRSNSRSDAGRAHHGKMVPTGAATMSDEEFAARMAMTAPTIDSLTTNRGGVLHGAFPHKAAKKDMAPY